MIIHAGYGDKPTEIRISGPYDDSARTAEFWIDQTVFESIKGVQSETLSYITLDELLDLKGEIQAAIRAIVGE